MTRAVHQSMTSSNEENDMSKHQDRKLSLRRETLRTLDPHALSRVGGASVGCAFVFALARGKDLADMWECANTGASVGH
ncbi:MAG TPA: hypothetical protein VMZ28_21120 [Kofleriaceae bacterium]|nr:hypothetical protein [Kofleriaceae bacterium]